VRDVAACGEAGSMGCGCAGSAKFPVGNFKGGNYHREAGLWKFPIGNFECEAAGGWLNENDYTPPMLSYTHCCHGFCKSLILRGTLVKCLIMCGTLGKSELSP